MSNVIFTAAVRILAKQEVYAQLLFHRDIMENVETTKLRQRQNNEKVKKTIDIVGRNTSLQMMATNLIPRCRKKDDFHTFHTQR
ncbi:unnamed protein product [Porites lobata]|uniref:Uncharacterized protein n=1 Tax=Porites lobata TaxID=104759 RepID=A0ABN8NP98_9CNID|nr:unnamed protein product [Porites lobata]